MQEVTQLEVLEANKSSIEDFFKDFLDEIKGFKHQMTLKSLLRKHKENGDKKIALVYFNSTSKTVINSEYVLLINIFRKFYVWLIIGLIKDLVG